MDPVINLRNISMSPHRKPYQLCTLISISSSLVEKPVRLETSMMDVNENGELYAWLPTEH